MHQLIHYNMGSKSAIGIGNGICFKQVRDKGGGSYIDPLVRDSIVGLWKFDQNTNESPTRNIIRNTIKDKGGDLELLNFGYKLNSGYNGYATDFTEWYGNYSNKTQTKITVSIDIYFPINIISFKNVTSAPSFRIKVSGLPKGQNLYYRYINEEGLLEERFNIPSDGIYTLPATAVSDTPTTVATLANEQYNINIKGLTIEQLPLYEGALVTDGKDDIIVSQKTVQEMLGGSNVCTVVSMIHQINLSTVSSITSINNIRSESVAHVCARHLNTAYGKTGISGYSKQLNTTSNPTLINNILGDKKDYIAEGGSVIDTTDKYFVQGYKYNDSLYELSEVAVYWTFIANKVLTTDEINQIIAYFKLDKYVTPQVIYDVKRQGLTNDTPAADWYLKDFSGNGHDMTLYNFAKKLGNGIGKYEADYSTWTKTAGVISTPFGLKITELTHNYWILYTSNITVPAHKVEISGIPEGGEFRYLGSHILKNGINELPKMEEHPSAIGFTLSKGTTQPSDWVGLSVEQIPDYEGALVFDAVDDYGQFVGDLGLQDYTIAVDRAYPSFKANGVPIISSIDTSAPFIFEFSTESDRISPFSYGASTVLMQNYPIDRKITYQSSYVYNSSSITKGDNTITGSGLTIGRYGVDAQYANIALWSLLLFPYSLSEFLLERQLKRYKLGTLYPDMVEWRPIYTSNVNDYTVTKTTYFGEAGQLDLTLGRHYSIGTRIRIYVKPNGAADEVTSIKVNGVELTYDYVDSNYSYAFNGTLSDKSPQKINITIDEYIRYEDIVQPYPAIINLKQDGKTITWGDKLKVGSDIVFVESANLLPELYTVSKTRYNGVTLYPNTIIKVEKSMVFDNARTYLKANEPNCILSPNRLRIPNSSYKILGYIPDLTSKGNHGKLNNFAYTEDSGVAADGSIKFDGIDDHITIPTLAHGGKCVMMKVNWSNNGMLYDQRVNSGIYTFSILTGEATLAYNARNNGSTYIDGILNANIIPSDLVGITHNITVVNDAAIDNNTVSPRLGVSVFNATFSNMSLYEFMLFPEIPSEDEIKKLNDVMGIEGRYVESPNYYWDAYGKKNTDTDRNLIADQVSKDVANALEVKNVAYNSESGYTDDNGLLLDGIEDRLTNTVIPAVTDYTWIMKREILGKRLCPVAYKGDGSTYLGGSMWFEQPGGGNGSCSFGSVFAGGLTFPKLISYQTKTSYNGTSINPGTDIDGTKLVIGARLDIQEYLDLVFYKAMLYTKTIDRLSINMLKNLFEKDELIDVNNPIFKKDEL